MGYRRHVRFNQLRLSLSMFTFYVCFDGADWMGGGHVTTAWKGSGQQQNGTRCLPGELSGDNMNGSEPWPWQYQYSTVFNRLIVHCKNIASVSTHTVPHVRIYLSLRGVILCASLAVALGFWQWLGPRGVRQFPRVIIIHVSIVLGRPYSLKGACFSTNTAAAMCIGGRQTRSPGYILITYILACSHQTLIGGGHDTHILGLAHYT